MKNINLLSTNDYSPLVNEDCFVETIKELGAKKYYCEEDMIGFVKYILSRKVTVAKSATGSDSYLPKEFQLLLGELEHNGIELLREWHEQ
jgi:hypothetical protein